VPFIVLLNVLITEILKDAHLLQGRMGILTLLCYIFVIYMVYTVLEMLHAVTKSGQVVNRTIQRFLEWAEHDIEEAQRLKIWSPHMELPSSLES
jgi:hypothetical protein